MVPTVRLVAVVVEEVCVDIGCFVGLGAKQMKCDDLASLHAVHPLADTHNWCFPHYHTFLDF